MKQLLKCECGKSILSDGTDGNDFGKPHVGCGRYIKSSSPVRDESLLYTCRICGELEYLHWNEELNRILKENQLCHHCNFWQQKINWRNNNDPTCFVIDGVHYKGEDGIVKDASTFLGHGGRTFTIETFDGRTLKTNNLWCQGRIPERFCNILTDNAKFIYETKRLH